MEIEGGWRLFSVRKAVDSGGRRQSHEGARIDSTSRGAHTAGHSRARVDVDWSSRNIKPLSTPQRYSRDRSLSRYTHTFCLHSRLFPRCNVSQLCINWNVNVYWLKDCETIQVKFKNTLATSAEWRESRCVLAASSTTSGGTRVVQVSILFALKSEEYKFFTGLRPSTPHRCHKQSRLQPIK